MYNSSYQIYLEEISRVLQEECDNYMHADNEEDEMYFYFKESNFVKPVVFTAYNTAASFIKILETFPSVCEAIVNHFSLGNREINMWFINNFFNEKYDFSECDKI